jgi:plastocyanin domain-containing protein
MSQYLWIAIMVTTVTIAAHALLFWWFLIRKPRK